MIALLSISLATYEAFALITRRRTVTDYSHTRPWGFLIWGWWALLAIHFIKESTNGHSS